MRQGDFTLFSRTHQPVAQALLELEAAEDMQADDFAVTVQPIFEQMKTPLEKVRNTPDNEGIWVAFVKFEMMTS